MDGEIDTASVESVPNTGPVYTKLQLYKIGAVYDFMARLLPTEGRDFSVKFTFGDPGDPEKFNVEIVPYTYIGNIWRDYCIKMFKQASKK